VSWGVQIFTNQLEGMLILMGHRILLQLPWFWSFNEKFMGDSADDTISRVDSNIPESENINPKKVSELRYTISQCV
jgi:hypothetical protein